MENDKLVERVIRDEGVLGAVVSLGVAVCVALLRVALEDPKA